MPPSTLPLLLYRQVIVCVTVSVFFCFAVACLPGCVTVKVSLWEEPGPLQEKVISGYGPDKILLLDISGLLLEQAPATWLGVGKQVSLPARLKEELQKAAADRRLKALVVRLHSPGGTVAAADLIYHELQQFKQQHHLPLVVSVLGLAASGGYYLAQAADVIVAQPTSLIGSIGVIALKFNLKGLLNRFGVETELVKTGRLKDLWSPFRPATAEEARIMQALLDDFHRRFVAVVAAGRNFDPATAQRLGDGRLFTATQALDLNLVDQLGYLDDAFNRAKELAGIETARIIMYHTADSYRGNVYATPMPQQGLGVLPDPVSPTLALPQFYYLWWPHHPAH